MVVLAMPQFHTVDELSFCRRSLNQILFSWPRPTLPERGAADGWPRKIPTIRSWVDLQPTKFLPTIDSSIEDPASAGGFYVDQAPSWSSSQEKASRTNGSVTLRKTQIGSKKLADRLRPLVPTDPPELVHQVVPETLQFDRADQNHMAGPSGIPSDE